MRGRKRVHAEAARKLQYVQWYLYRTQYEKRWVIASLDPATLLRNELKAFWEGRITVLGGWSDIIGQIVRAIVSPIESAFRWIWDNIMAPAINVALRGLVWIADRVVAILTPVWEGIKAFLGGLIAGARAIIDTIWSTLTSVWEWIKGIGGLIWSKLVEFGGIVWEKIMSGVQWLGSAVRAWIDGILNKLGEVWRGFVAAFEGVWRILSDVFARVGGVIAGAIAEIGKHIGGAFKWVWENLLVPAGNAVRSALEIILKPIFAVFEKIYETIINLAQGFAPITPDRGEAAGRAILKVLGTAVLGLGAMTVVGEAVPYVKHLGLGHISAMLYDMSGYKLIIGAMVGALAFVTIKQPFTYQMNALFRPVLPDRGSLMDAYNREIITKKDFYSLMAFHGYSDKNIDIFEKLTYTPMTHFMLAAVARAGYHDAQLCEKSLTQLGFRPEVRAALMGMYAAEAAFDVRGQFGATILTRFARGQIMAADLDGSLKALGYPKALREKLTSAAYHYRSNYLTEEYVESIRVAFRQGEIDEETAAILISEAAIAPEVVQQLLSADRIRKREVREKTREEEIRAFGIDIVLKRFIEGMINESEFRVEAGQLGYTHAQTNRYLILARLKQDYDFALSWLKTSQLAFERGILTEEEFLRELAAAGFGADQSRLYLKMSKLKLLPKIKWKGVAA